jgi:hypothetical protein
MRFKVISKSLVALLLFAHSLLAQAQKARPVDQEPNLARTSQPMLWREPADIKTRDLFYGPGSKDRQPQGKLTFIKEDMDGTNPKFSAEDERGIRWKVKLGVEAQPETAATRLVWAVGYFADEAYYLPQIKVEKLPRLRRGRKFVSADGTVRGARLDRDEKGDKKFGEWDWFDNPFAGTRELNGLRVLMALINNWDPKTANNSIRARQGIERAYYVSDLGSSFGRSGGTFSRTRNDLDGYARSTFIRRIKGDKVDFVLRTRASFYFILYPPYYFGRLRLEKVARDIPRADARWIGEWLKHLSPDQIVDAFRAAGYTPEQASAYARKVNERIAELVKL